MPDKISATHRKPTNCKFMCPQKINCVSTVGKDNLCYSQYALVVEKEEAPCRTRKVRLSNRRRRTMRKRIVPPTVLLVLSVAVFLHSISNILQCVTATRLQSESLSQKITALLLPVLLFPPAIAAGCIHYVAWNLYRRNQA